MYDRYAANHATIEQLADMDIMDDATDTSDLELLQEEAEEEAVRGRHAPRHMRSHWN